MAFFPYFALGPTSALCLVGLMRGPDKTIPTPADDYQQATIDLVIPAYNEEKNIAMCLESIATQTIMPSHIFLVDDGSTDKTSEYARLFAEAIGLKLTLIRREKSEGKTSVLRQIAGESKAEVLFVLDGDTILHSPNYIERCIQELYQGIGISAACGIVTPQVKGDRERLLSTPAIAKFIEKFPEMKGLQSDDRFFETTIINYREELYLFLQRFIYHGEMVFFGSLINPVGCAVAYRREYLKAVLEHYGAILGHNLTASEDVFIGFAFDNMGYRNIQIQQIFALTLEPRLERFPKQAIAWSSAFLQSCYYFNSLVCTPFKSPAALFRYIKNKLNSKYQQIVNKRKIQEAYRQAFGVEFTKKYGRPIGWFIFTSLFEKLAFPTIMIIFVILGLWKAFAFTLLAELTIYTFVIVLLHRRNRFKDALKSIAYTPVRYSILLLDIYVIVNFVKDIWITKNREWKK